MRGTKSYGQPDPVLLYRCSLWSHRKRLIVGIREEHQKQPKCIAERPHIIFEPTAEDPPRIRVRLVKKDEEIEGLTDEAFVATGLLRRNTIKHRQWSSNHHGESKHQGIVCMQWEEYEFPIHRLPTIEPRSFVGQL